MPLQNFPDMAVDSLESWVTPRTLGFLYHWGDWLAGVCFSGKSSFGGFLFIRRSTYNKPGSQMLNLYILYSREFRRHTGCSPCTPPLHYSPTPLFHYSAVPSSYRNVSVAQRNFNPLVRLTKQRKAVNLVGPQFYIIRLKHFLYNKVETYFI